MIRRHSYDEPDDVLHVGARIELPHTEYQIPPEPGQIPFPEKTPQQEGKCGRSVTLPDGNRFTIDVAHENGWPAPLCEVADQVMLSALEVLNRGQIPRRRRPFAENALARVDACKLLNSWDIEVALGGFAEVFPFFAGWGCVWVDESAVLSISFDRQLWPLDLSEGQATTVGPRPALVEAGALGSPDACQIEMAHRRFGSGQEWIETVEIFMDEEESGPTTHCAEIERLAELVGERLPG